MAENVFDVECLSIMVDERISPDCFRDVFGIPSKDFCTERKRGVTR